MPRTILPLAPAAAALALTAAHADAAVVPDIQDRVLTVTGDAAADRITLRIPAANPTSLELDLGDDGTADFRFARTQFDAVRVVAGDGDDRVRIDDGGTRFAHGSHDVLGGAGGTRDRRPRRRDAPGRRWRRQGRRRARRRRRRPRRGRRPLRLGRRRGNDDVDGGAGFDLVLADGTDADDRLTLEAAGAAPDRARTALGAAAVERVDVDGAGSDVVTSAISAGAVQQVEPTCRSG